MSLKRDILQIVFGAFLMALFLQTGLLSPSNAFWDNVMSGGLVLVISKVLSWVFGGFK